jgi:LemA protein
MNQYSFLIFVVFLAVGSIVIFNRLVRGRIHVQEGWSGIDVQLKRRHDLIPNFVETVKAYMGYERAVLEKVTQLRSQAGQATGVKERASLENGITQALKTIFAVVEAYPDLKASQHFLELQKSLTEVENEIQLARRYYNGTVRNYNILIETFPGNLYASVFRFKAADFFEIESSVDRAVPEVKL